MATSSAARRREAAKIEASLVRTLKIPMEKGRMEKRVLKLAADDPTEIIIILLKNYNNKSPKTAKEVRELLNQITSKKEGMRAVLNNITNPNQLVRKNIVEFLKEKKGFHAATYASFYENTSLLLSIARNKDIPVEDIAALAEVSKESYLDGETMEALQDIAACLDFIKHRHRAADMLKGYVSEMLKMAPDLSRMGIDDRIGEPLRNAIAVSKSRKFDETKDIIALRSQETTIRIILNRIGRSVKGIVHEKPFMDYPYMAGSDVWTISKLRSFIESVTSRTISGKREEGLQLLKDFLEKEYLEFYEDAKLRLETKDQSALFTAYTIALVCLKLASFLMPQTSEDIYQKYFRGFEPEASIYLVRWPDAVMKMIS